jgi:hypothetical protein
VTNRVIDVIDFIGVSSRVGSDAQHDNTVQCIPCQAVSKWHRCFTEDRGEGVEKSGGFHQEFVKEISFRKGITFYTFLIKRAGFAQGLFPTMCVCC